METGQFYRTSKEKRHSHVIYISPDGGAFCSEDNGHRHEVQFIVDQQLVAPEGQPIQPGAQLQTQTTIQVVILEGGKGKSLHTHSLGSVIEGEDSSFKPGDEDEVVTDVRRLYKESQNREQDFRKSGDKAEVFYDGSGQWDKQDIDALDNEERAHLTVNEIEPKIDLLTGHQKRNRHDIKYLPKENGDQRVADILNYVSKHICGNNNFEFEESRVFEDKTIVGRGNFDLSVTYDDTIEGDVVIEGFPWRDVYFGEHTKLDAKDLEYLIKTRWFSFDKVKQLWPEKSKEIQRDIAAYKALQTNDAQQQSAIDGDHYDDSEATTVTVDKDFINLKRKEFRILECQRKHYIRVPVLVVAEDDVFINAQGWDSKDLAAAKTIPGVTKVDKKVTQTRVSLVAGSVMLTDEIDEILTGDFSITPDYAKKRKKVWGKVEPAIDLQCEINKRHSQFVDILNKMAAYGWFYDDQTFMDEKEEARFRKTSAKPGFTAKVSDTSRPPLKVEGAKLPTEVVSMINQDSDKMREVMNVSPEMTGVGSNQKSGVAIATLRDAGMLGNEFLYDNFSLAKKELGRKLVKFIQAVYTPERIFRILGIEDQRADEKGVEIGGEPLSSFAPEDVIKMLENADLTEYDVAVSQSQYSPTAKMANFLMWAEMAQQGVQVPPQFLIELSDLPDKDKYIAMIEAANAAAAEQEKMKYDTEVQKSLIAAQSKSVNTNVNVDG